MVLGGIGRISDATANAVFSRDTKASVPDWISTETEHSQVKPENVETVRTYAAKLYADNAATDFDAYNGEIREFFNQQIREDGSIPQYIAGELDSAVLHKKPFCQFH